MILKNKTCPHFVGHGRCCGTVCVKAAAGVDSWGVQGQWGSTGQD